MGKLLDMNPEDVLRHAEEIVEPPELEVFLQHIQKQSTLIIYLYAQLEYWKMVVGSLLDNIPAADDKSPGSPEATRCRK